MDYYAIAQQMRQRLAILDDERSQLVRGIEAMDALAGLSKRGTDPLVATQGRSTRVAPMRQPTEVAVESILEDVGRPIQTRDLVPLVEKAGVEIGGKDKLATLSARLSNSALFRVKRGVGWWFTDRPMPDVDDEKLSFEGAEDLTVRGSPSAPNANEKGGEWHRASPA